MKENYQRIMDEYLQREEEYIQLGEKAVTKLREIIAKADINIMAIEHRIKDEESLRGKLERKGDKYECLDDLTDILGCRIITFFADDVDVIAKEIENSFVIDRENSVDKRALLDPDEFGYLSLHYICSFENDTRRFEIQIRSLLQHAWSAIYHDLGYKGPFDIPRETKRNFARIAGLLEIADNEFTEIREELTGYESCVGEKMASGEDLDLNVITLKEYLNGHRCVTDSADDPQEYLKPLHLLNVKKIHDLDELVKAYSEKASRLARVVEDEVHQLSLKWLIRAKASEIYHDEEGLEAFFKVVYSDSKAAKKNTKEVIKALKKSDKQ